MAGTSALVAVAVLIAVAGRMGAQALGGGQTGAGSPGDGFAHASGLEPTLLRILLGFGLVSLALFSLVYFGLFTTAGLCLTACVLLGLPLAFWLRACGARALGALARDIAAGLALALLLRFYGWLAPPYDLTIAGADSSVYIAAAHQLASGQRLRYTDPLVTEMTAQERAFLLEGPSSGRLPGGVWLLHGDQENVSFAFYHLLPAWLAFGLKTLGPEGDLRIWSLFPVLSLSASFLIGRSLGGLRLGGAFCLLQLCFLPQAFFSRFLSSELLAQALFLSGLAFLMNRLGRNAVVDPLAAAATGALWGALCLSRIDAVLFLSIGLTLLAFSRLSGLLERAWLLPAAWVPAWALLAIHHQLTSGLYLYLPGMQYVGGDRLRHLLQTLVVHPVVRIGVPIMVVAMIAAAHTALRGQTLPCRTCRVVRGLYVIPTLGMVVLFAPQLIWPRTVRHLEWLALYTTPVGLVALALGCGVLLWLRKGEPGSVLALSLLVGPTACYLINPMVMPVQPWAIRRFVPMVFPLLLLLALHGWGTVAARLWRDHRRLTQATQWGVFLAIASLLVAQSRRVVWPGVSAPTRAQLRVLAGVIPQRSLVLVSTQDAWLHLQTALEYVARRDALVLPLADATSRTTEAQISAYLGRQLAQGHRLVLLLAGDDRRAGSLPRSFSLGYRQTVPVDYVRVPFTRKDRLPPRVRLARVECRVYDVQAVGRTPAWREIQVGDTASDAVILLDGFYAPERAPAVAGGQLYRWTGPVARLALPPVAEAELLLDVRREPSTPAARLRVDVDGVPVKTLLDGRSGPQRLCLRLPREPMAANRIVTLRADAIGGVVPRVTNRTRALGVRVSAVAVGAASCGPASRGTADPGARRR